MKFLKSLFVRKNVNIQKGEVLVNTQNDELQDISDYAKRAINLLEQNEGSLDNEQVMELFEKNGFPSDVASRILVFLPIAFVRCWLTDVSWLNTYQVLLKDGTYVRRRYDQTKEYAEALAVTKEYFRKGPNPNTVLKIGGRSAEFNMLNNLLKDGGQLSHVRLTETVIIF